MLLTDDLQRAGARHRVALIRGEPGIGKTRLVSELAARAKTEGALVLCGRASEDSRRPFAMLAEALGHYIQHAPPAAIESMSESAATLASVIPEARRIASSAPGAGDAPQILAAARKMIEHAAVDRPVVLVLEDLHRAGESDVPMLEHLMGGEFRSPLLVAGTYRSNELRDGAGAAVLSALDGDAETTRLQLQPLPWEDALVLITELMGRGLRGAEARLAAELYREAAGNPLFLTELVRNLLLGGRGQRDRDRDRGGLENSGVPVPPSLADGVAERAAAPGPAAAELLGAAAVVGVGFDPVLVDEVLGRDPEDSAELWDQVERTELVAATEGGGFAFRHPLTRRILYERLGTRTRGRLHRLVAEALQARAGDCDPRELTRHWELAVPMDKERARDAAAAAAAEALAAAEARSAATFYRKALDLHASSRDGGDKRRCELLVGLGSARRMAGNERYRETLLEAARLADRIGEADLLVEAVLRNNRGYASTSGQVDPERVAVLEAALDAVGEEPAAERAYVLATLGAELTFSGQPEQRRALSDEALAIARRLGDRELLCYVLTVRFVTIWMPPTLSERIGNAAEAVRLADALGDRWAQFHAVHWQAVGLMQSGDAIAAGAAFDRLDPLANAAGDPTTRWIAAYERANLTTIAGRMDDAERLATDAAAIASESGQHDARPMFVSQLANIRYEQGRLGEMQRELVEAAAEYPGIPAFPILLALAYVEAGVFAEARNLLVSTVASSGEAPLGVTWLAMQTILAHVTAELGHREAAAVLYARLEPWNGQVVYAAIGPWGTVSHALGRLATLLGHFDIAEEHLRTAMEQASMIGAPVWLARTELTLAEALLARDEPGDGAESEALLTEAIVGAKRCEAVTVQRRAEGMLEHRRARQFTAAGGRDAQRLRLRPTPATRPRPGKLPAKPADRSRGTLELRGDHWVLEHDGRELRLKDSKGVRYLARLLANPGVEMHAADLQGGAVSGETVTAGSAKADGLSAQPAGGGDAGQILDETAKRKYRERIETLRETLDEAERFNDPERAASAREELDFVERELSAAVGLGGRDRRAASHAERARINVTRAVRGTLRRIAEEEETLGAHLDKAVRTGIFCAYEPLAGTEIEWDVSPDTP